MSIYPYLFGALNTREGEGDYKSRICSEPLLSMEDTLRRLANDSLECLRENENYLKRTLEEGVWVKGALPGKLINGKQAYIIGVAASGKWFFKTNYKDAYGRDLFYFIAYVCDTIPPEISMSPQYFSPILDAVAAMNHGEFSDSMEIKPLTDMGTGKPYVYNEKCRELEYDGGGIYPMEYADAAWSRPCGDGMVFINVMEVEDAQKIGKTYALAIICCRNIRDKEIFRKQRTTMSGRMDDKPEKENRENSLFGSRRYENLKRNQNGISRSGKDMNFILENLDTLTNEELASIYMLLQGRRNVEKEIQVLLQNAGADTVKRIYKKIKADTGTTRRFF